MPDVSWEVGTVANTLVTAFGNVILPAKAGFLEIKVSIEVFTWSGADLLT